MKVEYEKEEKGVHLAEITDHWGTAGVFLHMPRSLFKHIRFSCSYGLGSVSRLNGLRHHSTGSSLGSALLATFTPHILGLPLLMW